VHRPAELIDALAAARREAAGAFGSDVIYIEKAIQNARHIEFQILADQFGNCIYLGERECSIQRRHQKLIEEAPSVAITPELRAHMGDIAVRAARAVGYSNAGTIEFLLDGAGHFYFLEMNTRLQVEHPVTEMVTGIDIVKEQLSLASGRKLRWAQDDIHIKGHAIECRINAEDPHRDFLPAAGVVSSLIEPTGPGVRLESGIYAGVEITPYYDPLIAKLVVWGETRAEAILRMRRALEELRIGGIHTTVPFHQQVMNSARFQSGKFDTSYTDGPNGFRPSAEPLPDLERIAAIAAVLIENAREQQAITMAAQRGERPTSHASWRRAAWPRTSAGW
jgi:acetyl-CoA carboxylase, biotin carboxylase subunit